MLLPWIRETACATQDLQLCHYIRVNDKMHWAITHFFMRVFCFCSNNFSFSHSLCVIVKKKTKQNKPIHLYWETYKIGEEKQQHIYTIHWHSIRKQCVSLCFFLLLLQWNAIAQKWLRVLNRFQDYGSSYNSVWIGHWI